MCCVVWQFFVLNSSPPNVRVGTADDDAGVHLAAFDVCEIELKFLGSSRSRSTQYVVVVVGLRLMQFSMPDLDDDSWSPPHSTYATHIAAERASNQAASTFHMGQPFYFAH